MGLAPFIGLQAGSGVPTGQSEAATGPSAAVPRASQAGNSQQGAFSDWQSLQQHLLSAFSGQQHAQPPSSQAAVPAAAQTTSASAASGGQPSTASATHNPPVQPSVTPTGSDDILEDNDEAKETTVSQGAAAASGSVTAAPSSSAAAPAGGIVQGDNSKDKRPALPSRAAGLGSAGLPPRNKAAKKAPTKSATDGGEGPSSSRQAASSRPAPSQPQQDNVKRARMGDPTSDAAPSHQPSTAQQGVEEITRPAPRPASTQ